MLIPLRDGFHAVIDDADAPLVQGRRWTLLQTNGKVYARTSVAGRTVLLHRLLMGVTERTVYVDHKDRDGSNNRRANLRVTTPRGNVANSIKQSKAGMSSRFKGVSRHSDPDHRWHARITSHGKVYSLGLFLSEKAAAIAYNHAARRLFGEMALLNTIARS